MLLCYLLLFLNSILAAALDLVPGWEGTNGPVLGGVYWVTPKTLGLPGRAVFRMACIVLYGLADETYLVALMEPSNNANGLLAMSFFGYYATMLTSNGEVSLSNYRVFLHRTYVVRGSPEIMKLYGSSRELLEMRIEDWARLVLASGLKYGWGPDEIGPVINGVYWISPEVLKMETGTPGHYIPCVVLFRLENKQNWYRVVVMSRNRYAGGQPAINFFGHVTHLGLPTPDGTYLNDLEKYWIYPDEYSEVEGRPDIMQKWGQNVLEMPRSGADALRLLTKSHRIMKHHHVNQKPY